MKLTSLTIAKGLHVPLQRVNAWYEYLMDMFTKYGIESDQERLCFLAQMAYETSLLKRTVENLHYTTPERVLQVFPSYIKVKVFENEDPEMTYKRRIAEAKKYIKNPEKLANLVYANRLGNGDEKSGDGWLFIGRGGFHLTGRDHYTKYSEHIGFDCVADPYRVAQIDHACLSAGWYWRRNNLSRYANEFGLLTKAISGSQYTTKRRYALFTSLKEATQ